MKTYPKGLFFNNPRENAPDFVKGSLAVQKQALLEWLDQQQPNDKGYIYLDVLNGKENKPYIVVNDFKK